MKIRYVLASVALTLPMLAGGALSPANAATTSTRTLLARLSVANEHTAGYSSTKSFGGWLDADRDRCNTRYEVLYAEASPKPRINAGCKFTGGRWYSQYDGRVFTAVSGVDIDHVVAKAETWQSGAYRWTQARRVAFANDLGDGRALIAVSASSNRSKSDREPSQWLPTRTAYGCTFLVNWVAVKYRWNLSVNSAEKSDLTKRLAACRWPSTTLPARV